MAGKSDVARLAKCIRDCGEDAACRQGCEAQFVADGGKVQEVKEGGKVFTDPSGGKVFITDGGKVF